MKFLRIYLTLLLAAAPLQGMDKLTPSSKSERDEESVLYLTDTSSVKRIKPTIQEEQVTTPNGDQEELNEQSMMDSELLAWVKNSSENKSLGQKLKNHIKNQKIGVLINLSKQYPEELSIIRSFCEKSNLAP